MTLVEQRVHTQDIGGNAKVEIQYLAILLPKVAKMLPIFGKFGTILITRDILGVGHREQNHRQSHRNRQNSRHQVLRLSHTLRKRRWKNVRQLLHNF